jgi:Uncharacterised protein family (UPF0104).
MPQPNNRPRALRRSVTVLLTIAALGAVLAFADLRVVWNSLRGMNPAWAAGGFLLFLGSNLLLALRLSVVIPSRERGWFLRILDLAIVHGFLAAVLPARLGDVSYPLLARRFLQTGVPAGVSQIVVIRLYDSLAAILLLLATLTMVPLTTKHLHALVTGSSVLLVVLLAILLLLPGILKLSGRLLHRSSAHPLVQRTSGVVHEIADAFRALSASRHAGLLALTACRWVVASAVTLCAFRSVGVPLTPAGAVFLTTSVNLAISLSVQTIAGFGVADAAFGVALCALGYPLDLAVSYGLSGRMVRLSFLGATILLWLAIRRPLLASRGLNPPRLL